MVSSKGTSQLMCSNKKNNKILSIKSKKASLWCASNRLKSCKLCRAVLRPEQFYLFFIDSRLYVCANINCERRALAGRLGHARQVELRGQLVAALVEIGLVDGLTCGS